VQLKPQRCDYFEDGCELRIACRRQCLLQALAAQTGLSSDLGHSLGARDITQCCGDKGRVTFFECGL
jgi:hypothetical protein